MKTNIPLAALLMAVAIGVSACTPAANVVHLASEQEQIPAPRFFVHDDRGDGLLPQYTHIKVYQRTADCKVPQCPIVWHAEVPEKASPREIRYGQPSGFGMSTILSPSKLIKGKRYEMVLEAEDSVTTGASAMQFRVTETGLVVSD